MTTPDPAGEPPAPSPADGWGQPTSQTPGYVPPPPPPGAASGPPGDQRAPSQPSYGQPQYGAYGQPQYGQVSPGGPGLAAFGGPHPYAGPLPSAKPGIIPLRPLTLLEIFDGAFSAIRRNPRAMLGLPAIVITVSTALGALLGYFSSTYLIPVLPAAATSDPAFVENMAIITATFGAILTLSLASPIVNGLIIGSVGQSVIGHKVAVGKLWRQVRGQIWPLIGYSLLLAAIQMIAIALLVGAVILLASTGDGGIVAAILVALLGWLALVVGTCWLAIRVLLIPATLVLEKQRLWPAVRRGWRLSRGSFWRLLGIYLLATIAVSVIASILSTPFAFVGTLAIEPLGFGAYLAITSLGSILTGVLTASFTAAVVSLLYIDVRMRREGLDVELAAAAADPGTAWES